MTLQAWEYGDPQDVAARREAESRAKERACGECMHKRIREQGGEFIPQCLFKRRTFGRRCELFQREESNGS